MGDILISSAGATSILLPSTTPVHEHDAIITPPPKLRRDPFPNPQNGQADCSQAEQSASQASREAFQQASQSIQQASQQASQAAQQASQSASNAIQQAQNSASQSIAAMSRSSSSVVSSASSALSSIQASAGSAIARANGAMSSAQLSASLAQQEASRASSQIGANAAAANEQVRESQVSAVTATQAALAIVGSIIASTLLTSLIFFLIIRQRKKIKKTRPPSPTTSQQKYISDVKSPISDRSSSTSSTSAYTTDQVPTRNKTRNEPKDAYRDASSASQRHRPSESKVRETSVAWNPTNPPRAPTLNSWLRVQDGVSPFGPINLPTNLNSNAPLGGQLKSPLRTIDRAPSPDVSGEYRRPKIPILGRYLDDATRDGKETRLESSTKVEEFTSAEPMGMGKGQTYRESQTTIWTDIVPSTYRSAGPIVENPHTGLSINRGFKMDFPASKEPVRTTAEWLLEQRRGSDFGTGGLLPPDNSRLRASTDSRLSGLPRTPRVGLPVSIKSMKAEVQFVGGRRRPVEKNVTGGREGKGESNGGVGEAM